MGLRAERAYEAGLACPKCHASLRPAGGGVWVCTACETRFPDEEGVPNFIVGDRFPDADRLGLLEYEERANRSCAERYYLPTITRLTAGTPHAKVRVVSVGCGSGVDVEILTDAGFDAVGFDCGHRNAAWPRRRCAGQLLLANGQHAPFKTGWFDVAIMGCVFPHVGVVGDSFRVTANHRAARLGLAREMARIIRPGGHLVVSSPNRRCPVDLFHRHDTGRRIPRPNWPGDRFLLSLGDYRDLFVAGAGCRRVETLSIVGYWGFVNMGASRRTRLLRALLRGWFAAVSGLPALRTGPLAPWLCVHVVR